MPLDNSCNIALFLWFLQRKQEKTTRLEEDQVYGQLHDAMEALTHICRDGCRSIGRSDKSLNRGSTNCSFPACKRLQSLVRHFADCKLKVAGGCVHCKRMWQLLELHSRMCTTSDSCKVPLCGWVFRYLRCMKYAYTTAFERGTVGNIILSTDFARK